MFRFVVLLASLAFCHSHVVLPLVTHHDDVVLATVHGHHGHGYGLHGYGGHGYGHGHIYEGGHGYGYGGHGYGGLSYVEHGLHGHGAHHLLKRSPHLVHQVAHVAPVPVSYQSRVDVHAPLHYAVGHHGAGHYGAGHYGGVGYYGTGHQGYY